MRALPDPDPGIPDTRSVTRYLLWLAGRHPAITVTASVLGSLCMIAQALLPAAVGRAVDHGIVASDGPALLRWSGVVLALGCCQALTSILYDRFALTASLDGAYRTLQLVSAQVCRLGSTLTRRVTAGEVLSVGLSDINQVGAVLEAVGRAVASAAAVLLVAAIMLGTSWQLGLIVLVGVPVMAWLTGLSVRPLHARADQLRQQQARLTDHTVDIAGGLRVLLGVGGEQMFAGRYRNESEAVRRNSVQVARAEVALDMVKALLPGLLIVAVVWIGVRSVAAGTISAGQLVAFYGYAVFLAIPLQRLMGTLGQLTRGRVAAGRIIRILTAEPEFPPGLAAGPTHDPVSSLTDPASGLDIRAGLLVAVVGSEPAGLAAIADRLGRYVDSEATVNGTPLSERDVAWTRDRVLVATHDARLFTGPLRTELDPAGHANRDPGRLGRAIDAASAADIFEPLADGLDGEIVGSGREFSGGEQQRLRLVRALTTDPEVLILIDPTSAVDAHTETRIAERLRSDRAGRTTVVFTSSPIMANNADRVVLVENGRVVAQGTHRTLLADPRYHSLVTRGEDL